MSPGGKMINLSRVWAVTLRHLFLWRRSINQIGEAIYWPALDVITWGFVSRYLWQRRLGDLNIVTLFLGGLIFYRIFTQFQHEINVPFLEEVWNNNLLNIFASPVSIWEYQLGTIFLSLIKLVVSVLTMLILSSILYAFNIFKFGFYIIPFILSLVIFSWAVAFLINGIILRYGRNWESMAWVIPWGLMPFSCVFYPLSSLPFWGQKIATILPSTYLFEGMRQIMTFGKPDFSFLFLSFILDFIYLIFSLFFFKWAFDFAREKGILKKLD